MHEQHNFVIEAAIIGQEDEDRVYLRSLNPETWDTRLARAMRFADKQQAVELMDYYHIRKGEVVEEKEFDWYEAVRRLVPNASMGSEEYRNAGEMVDIYLEDNDNPSIDECIAWCTQ